MLRKLPLGLLVVSVGVWIGCSETESTTTPGPTGADASTGEDAPSSTEDGGSNTTPSVDPLESIDGNVGLLFGLSDAKGGRVGASFYVDFKDDPATTKKKVGPCVVTTYGSGEPPTDVHASAGTIKISGGTSDVELTPTGDKTYDPIEKANAFWNGGEAISVHADGKDVPAFDLSFKAPSKVTVTTPALSKLTHKRAEPFTATWEGDSSGMVILYFDAAAAENAYSMKCAFDRSAGTGTVPAAAFADFPAADGTFDFYVQETVMTTGADWKMRFSATTSMRDPGGKVAAGTATFE